MLFIKYSLGNIGTIFFTLLLIIRNTEFFSNFSNLLQTWKPTECFLVLFLYYSTWIVTRSIQSGQKWAFTSGNSTLPFLPTWFLIRSETDEVDVAAKSAFKYPTLFHIHSSIYSPSRRTCSSEVFLWLQSTLQMSEWYTYTSALIQSRGLDCALHKVNCFASAFRGFSVALIENACSLEKSACT